MESLNNPIWASLSSRHRALALGSGDVLRYPADVAPFLGVAHAAVDVAQALDALVPSGDTVLLLGVMPRVPQGWQLHAFDALAQMTCDQKLPIPDGPEVVELGPTHRDDVLALTALVYPHYFRHRTMALGRYFGIYLQGQLAAMIGERLGGTGCRELSAICTHPAFTGRGLARRLTAMLVNRTLDNGELPFLHVSHANARAHALYRAMGFATRCDIGFCSLQRSA